jgi:RHS repeat-associated protein
MTASGSTVNPGQAVYEENLAGFPFGTVIRLRPQGLIVGSLTLNVTGGAVLDEWGLSNPAEQITITLNAPGAVLFQGPPPGSTAPPRLARSALGSPFLFHGQYFDYDAGLVYLRARFYDPYTGSFLQQDPEGYADSVNLYAGFGHNPTSKRDPNGTAPNKPRQPTPVSASGRNVAHIDSTPNLPRPAPRIATARGPEPGASSTSHRTIAETERNEPLGSSKPHDPQVRGRRVDAFPDEVTQPDLRIEPTPPGVPKPHPFDNINPSYKTEHYAIYRDAQGNARVRFRASEARVGGEASEGRNMSPEVMAVLNAEGEVFVHEGRHRTIGAAHGAEISEANGGVPGHPGWLDFPLDPEFLGPSEKRGVLARELTIDKFNDVDTPEKAEATRQLIEVMTEIFAQAEEEGLIQKP